MESDYKSQFENQWCSKLLYSTIKDKATEEIPSETKEGIIMKQKREVSPISLKTC